MTSAFHRGCGQRSREGPAELGGLAMASGSHGGAQTARVCSGLWGNLTAVRGNCIAAAGPGTLCEKTLGTLPIFFGQQHKLAFPLAKDQSPWEMLFCFSEVSKAGCENIVVSHT